MISANIHGKYKSIFLQAIPVKTQGSFFNQFSGILDVDLVAYIIWDSAYLDNFAVFFVTIYLIETCIHLNNF